MTPDHTDDRFLALAFVSVDMPMPNLSIYTFECECGQCEGVRLHMSKFQMFFLDPCPVIIGDFDAMALVGYDPETCAVMHVHSGKPRDTIAAVCVQTLTDKE